jgi:drug/metabolite transporter (DMT)-like permease
VAAGDWQRTMLVYGCLAAAGVLGAVSDAVLNQWARTNRLPWLLSAYAAWLVVATLLGFVLRWQYFSFASAVVLFLVVNSAGVVVIDIAFFSGRMTAWQWGGIVLAVAAVCCIEVGRTKTHGGTSQPPRPSRSAPGVADANAASENLPSSQNA